MSPFHKKRLNMGWYLPAKLPFLLDRYAKSISRRLISAFFTINLEEKEIN